MSNLTQFGWSAALLPFALALAFTILYATRIRGWTRHDLRKLGVFYVAEVLASIVSLAYFIVVAGATAGIFKALKFLTADVQSRSVYLTVAIILWTGSLILAQFTYWGHFIRLENAKSEEPAQVHPPSRVIVAFSWFFPTLDSWMALAVREAKSAKREPNKKHRRWGKKLHEHFGDGAPLLLEEAYKKWIELDDQRKQNYKSFSSKSKLKRAKQTNSALESTYQIIECIVGAENGGFLSDHHLHNLIGDKKSNPQGSIES